MNQSVPLPVFVKHPVPSLLLVVSREIVLLPVHPEVLSQLSSIVIPPGVAVGVGVGVGVAVGVGVGVGVGVAVVTGVGVGVGVGVAVVVGVGVGVAPESVSVNLRSSILQVILAERGR